MSKSLEKISTTLLDSKELTPDSVAEKFEQYFVSDLNDLSVTLGLFSFENLTEIFMYVGEFFNERFDLEALTRESIENIDIKSLAYEFANKFKIERPLVKDNYERDKTIEIFGKLIRIFIHEICFPELVKIDPNLALSVKNQLKNTIGAIATIEGVDRAFAYDLIKVDDINVHAPASVLSLPQTPIRDIKKEASVFFKTSLKDRDIDKLGKELKTTYGVISSQTEFSGLINSDGSWSGSIKLKNGKQKWFVWLIGQMCKPGGGQRGLIWLNRTKGFWKHLQGVVIDENGRWFPREFAKIYNEIKKQDTEEHRLIKNDIDSILKQLKKI